MLNCKLYLAIWHQLSYRSRANAPVYRWFPTGKIVFLAPTKPLVNQQIEACQMTCGIPSKDAAVMTGSSVSAKERVKLVSIIAL
jgi:ERCC4-related helicase